MIKTTLKNENSNKIETQQNNASTNDSENRLVLN